MNRLAFVVNVIIVFVKGHGGPYLPVAALVGAALLCVLLWTCRWKVQAPLWRSAVVVAVVAVLASSGAVLRGAWLEAGQAWDLKVDIRTLAGDGNAEIGLQRLRASFGRVETAVARRTEEIRRNPDNAVPAVPFADIASGRVSAEKRRAIRDSGVVIIRQVVPEKTAKTWLNALDEYLVKNPDHHGFPMQSPQILEIYYSTAQVEARQHANMVRAAQFLNSLWSWHSPIAGDDNGASTRVYCDPNRTEMYHDRVRMRQPGDASLSLGPHIDNGSWERWAHPSYQKVYRDVYAGKWEELDPYDTAYRVRTKEIEAPNQATFFRSHQGWLALTAAGPGDGGLQVLPVLKEAIAYTLLQPLVQDDAKFCGATQGHSQRILPGCHDALLQGIVSIPKVNPGDYVAWHPDLIHGVEQQHTGSSRSVALFIPTAPLTEKNAKYLRRQREAMRKGKTPPDFPQLDAEVNYISRGSPGSLTATGARQLGFAAYPIPPESGSAVEHQRRELIARCNAILAGT